MLYMGAVERESLLDIFDLEMGAGGRNKRKEGS